MIKIKRNAKNEFLYFVTIETWDGDDPIAVFRDKGRAEHFCCDYKAKRGGDKPSVREIPVDPPDVDYEEDTDQTDAILRDTLEMIRK